MRESTEYKLKSSLGDVLHENGYDIQQTASDIVESIEFMCVKHFALEDIDGLPFEEALKNAIEKTIINRRPSYATH